MTNKTFSDAQLMCMDERKKADEEQKKSNN